jgi:uncharacterized protein (TIGR02466 family)
MDNIFPIVVHNFDFLNFKNLQNELIEYAYKEKKKNPKGVQKSNRGGWQSSNIGISKNIIVEELFKSIVNYFQSNDILIKDTSLKVTNIWINVNGKGDCNNKHQHPGADLSGVFWIKSVGPDSGMLCFESPYTYIGCKNIVTMNPKIKDEFAAWQLIRYAPTEGKICIFPAFLDHWVQENNSNEDRISVSFNIVLLPPPDAE